MGLGDVVVIGAGVIGAATGLELARAGWRVAIVDRGAGVGTGSTAASSAVVRFTYSTHAGTAMAYESSEWWRTWSDHVRLPPGAPLARFVQCGMLFFDDPSGAARGSVAMLDEVGVAYEWWSLDELQARMPHLSTGSWFPPTALTDAAFAADPTARLGGALYTPEAGYVTDPQLAAQNLADAAVAAGATVRVRAEVVAIERRAGRVVGVRLGDGELLAADVVVNAAGPHSARVNAMAEVLDDMRVHTRPLRQQVAHVVVPPAADVPVDHHPVTADIDGGIYFRPDGQAFLVGGVEADCDPLVWLDGGDLVDDELDGDEWDTHVYRLARRIPAVGVPHQRRGVVGVYDVSDDWMPVLDRSSLAGFYMAVGSSGNQFKNAPVIGHCMARLVEAVELEGHDHDRDPVVVAGMHRAVDIDLGTFSRLRSVSDEQRARGVLG
jgi:glycine/D-amino acid oxidase-like deaminating enzyme